MLTAWKKLNFPLSDSRRLEVSKNPAIEQQIIKKKILIPPNF